jgi:hypothetical protein
MLRRTHEDQLFGAPILKLPHAAQNTLDINLARFEGVVYNLILDKYEKIFLAAPGKNKKANVISR